MARKKKKQNELNTTSIDEISTEEVVETQTVQSAPIDEVSEKPVKKPRAKKKTEPVLEEVDEIVEEIPQDVQVVEEPVKEIAQKSSKKTKGRKAPELNDDVTPTMEEVQQSEEQSTEQPLEVVEETLPLLALAKGAEGDVEVDVPVEEVVTIADEPSISIETPTEVQEEPEKQLSILDMPIKKTSFFEVLFPNATKKREEKKNSRKKRQHIKKENIVRYSPDLSTGLNEQQVEERDTHYLTNKVEQKFSKSYASIICGNLFTFFNLLGLIVTIALAFSKAELGQYFYVLIYILNIAIGIIQEIRAKHSIEKLSLISTKTSIVLRNGLEQEIPSTEIVLDDLIKYSIGKQIVTDGIIMDGEVEVNESLLTGESVAVKKKVGDKLFAGSFITSGVCIAQATVVGSDNYVEKLSAKAKKYKKPNSQIMRSLSVLITTIGILIIPIAILTFVSKIKGVTDLLVFENYFKPIQETAGSIIGMIPAGMFLLTSMALAVGVIRLSRHNTLVQDLYSLEMLARVDVLCLDKTGTITDGRMKVNDCILMNNTTNYTISEIMGSMLSALHDSNQTSVALYNHFGHSNALKAIKTIPFSSDKKLSAVTFAEGGTFSYGAPEFVLKEIPEKLKNLIRQYASMGLRVLILAHSKSSISASGTLPSQMKPIAIITIADNIRENAAKTIAWFKENDVALKVISGDNPLTVSEIARRVGVPNADKYISLEGMSERDVIAVADSYTVFGRVTPEQKAILIKSMKLAGHSVAMTGDGVNDILAMKEADCAVSLASGSEATRNISHLVLMDNNFNSMPKVVNEGRRVINNIQNSASLYLMKTLFVMLISVLSLIIGQDYPFQTNHLMMLEIFVIGVPSFFLSLQENNNRVEGNFISYVLTKAFPCALLMVISCLLVMCAHLIFGNTYFHEDVYTTLMVYSVTYSGLMMLYRICKPFNLFRGVLYTICLTAVIIITGIAMSQGMALLDLVKLTPLLDYWHHILIIVTIIMADIPLSSSIDYAMAILRGQKKFKKDSKDKK